MAKHVVVTERGIAINPRRTDLLEKVKGSGLPIRPVQDIKADVEKICGGKPRKARFVRRPVAVVKWVDGTVLDTVWQLAEKPPPAASSPANLLKAPGCQPGGSESEARPGSQTYPSLEPAGCCQRRPAGLTGCASVQGKTTRRELCCLGYQFWIAAASGVGRPQVQVE